MILRWELQNLRQTPNASRTLYAYCNSFAYAWVSKGRDMQLWLHVRCSTELNSLTGWLAKDSGPSSACMRSCDNAGSVSMQSASYNVKLHLNARCVLGTLLIILLFLLKLYKNWPIHGRFNGCWLYVRLKPLRFKVWIHLVAAHDAFVDAWCTCTGSHRQSFKRASKAQPGRGVQSIKASMGMPNWAPSAAPSIWFAGHRQSYHWGQSNWPIIPCLPGQGMCACAACLCPKKTMALGPTGQLRQLARWRSLADAPNGHSEWADDGEALLQMPG